MPQIDWSMFDGALGIVLVTVIIWAALKLVSRLIIAVILVIAVAFIFFGMHLEDFGIRLG